MEQHELMGLTRWGEGEEERCESEWIFPDRQGCAPGSGGYARCERANWHGGDHFCTRKTNISRTIRKRWKGDRPAEGLEAYVNTLLEGKEKALADLKPVRECNERLAEKNARYRETIEELRKAAVKPMDIAGFTTADAKKTLDIGVGTDAADYYAFDGTVTLGPPNSALYTEQPTEGKLMKMLKLLPWVAVAVLLGRDADWGMMLQMALNAGDIGDRLRPLGQGILGVGGPLLGYFLLRHGAKRFDDEENPDVALPAIQMFLGAGTLLAGIVQAAHWLNG